MTHKQTQRRLTPPWGRKAVSRLLLVTHYYADHGGGIEIVAERLAQQLAGRGLQIVWAASGPASSAPAPGVTPLPMRAWNGTEKRWGVPYPLWTPGSMRRLQRELRRCDMVHIHDCLYLGNLLAALGCGVYRKPLLVTQHIGLVPYRNCLLRAAMAAANRTVGKLVLRHADGVVFISQTVQQYWCQRRGLHRAARFIPNGVATDLFHPLEPAARIRLRRDLGWPDQTSVLLFVGRFVEKKGLAYLRRLAQDCPQCQWVFAGWGPDDPANWRLPNVTCLGRQTQRELAACYQAADLLVLPAQGEGFPLVVQESMACGTPALVSAEIAAGMPGLASLCWVSELDGVKLRACVAAAISSPDRLMERRAATAEFARRHWNWDTCAAQYAALIGELSASAT